MNTEEMENNAEEGKAKLFITVSPKYRIAVEKKQFVLQERQLGKRGKSTGKVYWDSLYFYTALEHCVPELTHLKLTELSGNITFAEAVKKLGEYREWAENLLRRQ